MKLSKGVVLTAVFMAVFISGCDNSTDNASVKLTERTAYTLDANNKAWLHDYLPDGAVAYFNIPTPWNYLFDAKADAMHPIQALDAHAQQVAKIKQGVKDNYFKFVPVTYQGMLSLLVEHMKTSLEVAVINNAPSALLPTVAVGTRLQNISAADLVSHLNDVLHQVDPSINLEYLDSVSMWSFKAGQFPAFVKYEEADGRLLIYGGMGASQDKMNALWSQPKPDQLEKIKRFNQASDPSGLNMKMWVAAARLYQMGKAFVPPAEQQMIGQFGLDQMDYIWFGTESNQGQSALALHVMMPETGWRLAVPRAADWFDVEVAGKPNSVMQFTLPTSAQVKQGIEYFKLDEKMTDSDRKEMQVWREIGDAVGFDFYDLLDGYHQQIIYVNDDSGSWFAMKIKDQALHKKMEKGFNEYFNIKPEAKQLEGVEIMQAHFSLYQKMFEKQANLPADAAQIQAFLNVFKEHAYWYQEGDVFYMSKVPQVLSVKKRHANTMQLSAWLDKNQGGDWGSAIFAYGKDVKNLPQELYHYYLLLLQGLGDLAQTEIDLFALPTANALNLPESGRINLVLSSDAEKVSFKFGYEYSMLEPIMTAEGGFAALAVAGILAAYAVPAYRDYVVRAKIGEQLALSAGIKITAAEQFIGNGSFTGVNEVLAMPAPNFSFDEEMGIITIDLSTVDGAFVPGDELYLEAVTDAGYLEWYCHSNIKAAYLPASCRD